MIMIESKAFSDIQGYWDSKRENEIDIVAINETEKRLVFCEVKRNPKHIRLEKIQHKAKNIIAGYPDFSVELKGLSLADM